MTDPQETLGVGIAVLDRFTNYTLPRLIDLQARMEAGERLGELDITFLREALERAEMVRPLVGDDPVSQALYAKAIRLYNEITAQGLVNEQQGDGAAG